MVTILAWILWLVVFALGLSWVHYVRAYAGRGEAMNQAMPLLAGFLTVCPLVLLLLDLNKFHLLWIAPAGGAVIALTSSAYPSIMRPLSMLVYRVICIGLRGRR